MDKARRTLQDVFSFAQEVAGDEQLRSNVSAALARGSKATDQVKKDIHAGGYSRLAADKKLQKNLRAMLDDLDAASNRVRRTSHRLRNFVLVLVLAGIGAAAVAFPRIRPWLTKRPEDLGTSSTDPDAMT
jgi:hypothetical protein